MTDASLNSAIRAHGDAALKGLDEIPNGDSAVTRQKLGDIMQHLAQMRDGFIAERRADKHVDPLLAQTNMIISLLFGAEFPVKGFKKKLVEECRGELRTLLEDIAGSR